MVKGAWLMPDPVVQILEPCSVHYTRQMDGIAIIMGEMISWSGWQFDSREFVASRVFSSLTSIIGRKKESLHVF
jgi:hypothetical protein